MPAPARARFRRSPSTPSCRTARPAPSWPRAATSSGSACRASTRRASSGRCSTATPVASASGPADVDVPAGPALPAGHDGARDELGHARRLDHRPRRAADRALAPRARPLDTRTGAPRPTTTPTTCCCASCAASTARCSCGWTASPGSSTASVPAKWEYTRPRLPRGRRLGEGEDSDLQLKLTTDLRIGFEGPRATARTLMKEGETRFCALSWSEHEPPQDYEDRLQPARLDGPPLAALARPRRVPRPPLAHLPPAQRADAQGPDVRSHGRHGRGRHDVAARDPWR